jgi:hypothetical protein
LAEAPPDHPSNTFLRRSLSSENDKKEDTQKDISEDPSSRNSKKKNEIKKSKEEPQSRPPCIKARH